MLACKWFDLACGVDLHMEMVPTPAPVPTPFPHPFMAIVFDPMGFVMEEVIASVTAWATDTPPDPGHVMIASLPATVTGDEVSMPVPHIFIPPGVSWAPVPRVPMPKVGLKGKLPMPEPPIPPPSDALLLMGSQTVSVKGSNPVRMGEIVLSCSDPVRMPTSAIIALGMPMPVMIGGPPGINWAEVVMMAGMKALRNKWTAGLMHKGIDKVIPKKFKRARNIAHKSACFLTGHPVNVATGSVITEAIDFELPGPLPIKFERNYNSNWFDRPSPVGHGWAHSLDQQVWLEKETVVVLLDDGREVEFDTRKLHGGVMSKGDTLFDPVNRLTLRSHGKFHFSLEEVSGVVTDFMPVPGTSPQDADRGLAKIVRRRSPEGFEVRFRYDDKAQLAEVEDAGGRVIKFEHDPRGMLKRIWLPASTQDGREGHRQHAEFFYDDEGDLIESRDAAGKPMRYGYDQHLLVRERDRNGLTFYFKYDGYGRYARCIETWGIDPNPCDGADPEAGIYHHIIDYNRKGRATTVTNSLGAVTAYQYDGAFQVTSVVDAHGGQTTFEYDHAHRETAVVDPAGGRTETTYDEHGNVVMVVAPGKRVSKVRYDEKHRPLEIVGPEGATWQWRYDGMGRVLSRVDPLGHTTHYRYEGQRLQQLLDAAGRPTTLTWNSAGGLATATAPDGTVTQWKRDVLGRVVERTDANGNVQRRSYDALGRIVRVEDPDGNVRSLAYDAGGNVIRARDRTRDITLTYCQMGKVASRSVGRTTVKYRYDTEGQLVGVVNERGLEHRFEVDALGEVKAEFGWDGLQKVFDRDPLGRVTRVFREAKGESADMTYDEAGNLAAVIYSDGPSESFAYRKDGALIEAKSDDIVVRFERDLLGNILQERVRGIEPTETETGTETETETETETASGTGTETETETGTETASETEPDDWDWVRSAYDHRGLRIALESSRGSAADIVRNFMGDVTEVAYRDGAHRWSAKFSRDRLGLEVDRVVAGKGPATRGYWWRDAMGRPTQHWVGAASAPQGHEPANHRLRKYTWDPGDQLRRLEDDQLGTITYEHDVRGYLHKAEVSPKGGGEPRVELRNPDEVGNLFNSLGRDDREYGEAGQILKHNGPNGVTTYRYDEDGNLAEREDPDGGTWWLHWDGAGRLSQVDRPDGTAVTFRYDALGRRVEKNANGQITRWIWDGNVPLHEWRDEGEPPAAKRTLQLAKRKESLLALRETLRELDDPEETRWFDALREQSQYDAVAAEVLREATGEGPEPPPPDEDGLITWLFEPESFSPLARVSEKRGAMAVFTDHLGTPLCLTDDAGEVVWSGVTDTFGRVEVSEKSDPGLCPWRFPGQYEDAETGLYYNRFRYYEPGVGGYVSRDPIGLNGGYALLGYVNDPLSSLDPLGLSSCGPPSDFVKPGLSVRQGKAVDPGLAAFEADLTARGINVRGRNLEIVDSKGNVVGEVDILTDSAAIQYKDGTSSASALYDQITNKTEPFVDIPVVGFVGAKHRGGDRTVDNAKRLGLAVENDMDELAKILR